jgi:hypothetical protein
MGKETKPKIPISDSTRVSFHFQNPRTCSSPRTPEQAERISSPLALSVTSYLTVVFEELSRLTPPATFGFLPL